MKIFRSIFKIPQTVSSYAAQSWLATFSTMSHKRQTGDSRTAVDKVLSHQGTCHTSSNRWTQDFIKMMDVNTINDFVAITIIGYNYIVNEKRQKKNDILGVHPYISGRLTRHFYLRHEKLCLYMDKFFNYYRMSKTSFEELLSKIEHGLLKFDTNTRLHAKTRWLRINYQHGTLLLPLVWLDTSVFMQFVLSQKHFMLSCRASTTADSHDAEPMWLLSYVCICDYRQRNVS